MPAGCCALRARTLGALAVLMCLGTVCAEETKPPAAPQPGPTPEKDVAKELFSGRVVFLPEALARRGIKCSDEMRGQVVLETPTGEIWPIVADARGRAFFQDERLRNRPVDLIARHHPGVPYLQVLVVYTFDEKGVRQFTDYWCDICSIPMYELKDCDCCQGPIRLRFQPQELPSFLKPPAQEKKPSPAAE